MAEKNEAVGIEWEKWLALEIWTLRDACHLVCESRRDSIGAWVAKSRAVNELYSAAVNAIITDNPFDAIAEEGEVDLRGRPRRIYAKTWYIRKPREFVRWAQDRGYEPPTVFREFIKESKRRPQAEALKEKAAERAADMLGAGLWCIRQDYEGCCRGKRGLSGASLYEAVAARASDLWPEKKEPPLGFAKGKELYQKHLNRVKVRHELRTKNEEKPSGKPRF